MLLLSCVFVCLCFVSVDCFCVVDLSSMRVLAVFVVVLLRWMLLVLPLFCMCCVVCLVNHVI